SPFNPNTPRLFEANCPVAVTPPTALFAAPATPVVVRVVASTAPPAALVALPAALVTVPTVPPAVEATPPSVLRPPLITRPPPAPPHPPPPPPPPPQPPPTNPPPPPPCSLQYLRSPAPGCFHSAQSPARSSESPCRKQFPAPTPHPLSRVPTPASRARRASTLWVRSSCLPTSALVSYARPLDRPALPSSRQPTHLTQR